MTRRLGAVCLGLALAAAAGAAAPVAAPTVRTLPSRFEYPEAARRGHAQGRVLLGFQLDADGHAQHIEMRKQEAIDALVDAARSDLALVTFEPPKDPKALYQVSFVFEVQGCGTLRHFDVPAPARISVCGDVQRQ